MLHSQMLNRSLTAVAVFCLFCSAAYSQQIFDRSTTLRNVTFNGVDLAVVLANFAYDYNVIIDLETDPAKPRSPITLQLSNVVFPQILDGIVAAEPLYQWRERDGHIEVFPISGSLNLLDQRVDVFEVKDVNREVAANRLFGVADVRALLVTKNLKPRPPYPVSDRIKDEKLSFNLHDVTLREALNQIANESGARFWVFRTYPDGTFEIRFQAA